MSKQKSLQKQGQPRENPRPKPRPIEVAEEKKWFPGSKYVCFTMELKNISKQNEMMNDMDSKGFEMFETVQIGGNEILLRFRKK